MPHKLAAVYSVVHQPWLVAVGFPEHLQPHEDVVGRFRDEDNGIECRLVATDGAQATFLVGDPRFVVGFADNVGEFQSKGLR